MRGPAPDPEPDDNIDHALIDRIETQHPPGCDVETSEVEQEIERQIGHREHGDDGCAFEAVDLPELDQQGIEAPERADSDEAEIAPQGAARRAGAARDGEAGEPRQDADDTDDE